MAAKNKMIWSSESASKAQDGSGSSRRSEGGVSDLLHRLNLAAGEDEKLVMSDDEDVEEEAGEDVRFSLIGKVLSPTVLHLQTIMGAMRPAWGNPRGLRARTVSDNRFIVDFVTIGDMERGLDGTPWLVGRHAVLLQRLVKAQKPSDVRFDDMHIWVCLIDIPFEWMNDKKGKKVAGLEGTVDKVDVDEYGEAVGNFLRARVAIPVEKPLKRFITVERRKIDEVYDVQYEKLPFFCFSCGVMGHSEIECLAPNDRDQQGKRGYNNSIRAPEEKRKKMQSFSQAAAASDWSGSSARSDSRANSRGKSS
ncbi:hypothetical protein ACQ4PT_029613 [Festuca glaucescens]